MNKTKGFTLIELMIVVAIIAILAAIALPAYQDYITRSKVSELIVAADACKNSVTEAYQVQNVLPATSADAGCDTQVTQYVNGMAVVNGVVTATANTAGNGIPAAAAGNYVLNPTVNAANAGILDWDCLASTIPPKYLPASCR
ncbi:MAG: pilin [Xanthomonadales bacterium]|nr:pilin [Xanthomonadales bacterium]